MTLDKLIFKLEEIKRELGRGDIPVQIPTVEGEYITFISFDEEAIDATSDEYTAEEVGGNKPMIYQAVFIDVHNLLEVVKD